MSTDRKKEFQMVLKDFNYMTTTNKRLLEDSRGFQRIPEDSKKLAKKTQKFGQRSLRMSPYLLWETMIYFRFYNGLAKLRLQNCTSRSFLSTLFSLGVASKLFWAAGGVETWLFVSGMEWDASEQMLFTSLCVAFTSSSVIFWLQLPLLLLRWLFWLFLVKIS